MNYVTARGAGQNTTVDNGTLHFSASLDQQNAENQQHKANPHQPLKRQDAKLDSILIDFCHFSFNNHQDRYLNYLKLFFISPGNRLMDNNFDLRLK